ncbi:hypothetical protein C8R46DRAFT_1221831 [Mycena filopes]|nr:hypothetical protein C8R46DRAFT_1221831 [Mycena filopes]
MSQPPALPPATNGGSSNDGSNPRGSQDEGGASGGKGKGKAKMTAEEVEVDAHEWEREREEQEKEKEEENAADQADREQLFRYWAEQLDTQEAQAEEREKVVKAERARLAAIRQGLAGLSTAELRGPVIPEAENLLPPIQAAALVRRDLGNFGDCPRTPTGDGNETSSEEEEDAAEGKLAAAPASKQEEVLSDAGAHVAAEAGRSEHAILADHQETRADNKVDRSAKRPRRSSRAGRGGAGQGWAEPLPEGPRMRVDTLRERVDAVEAELERTRAALTNARLQISFDHFNLRGLVENDLGTPLHTEARESLQSETRAEMLVTVEAEVMAAEVTEVAAEQKKREERALKKKEKERKREERRKKKRAPTPAPVAGPSHCRSRSCSDPWPAGFEVACGPSVGGRERADAGGEHAEAVGAEKSEEAGMGWRSRVKPAEVGGVQSQRCQCAPPPPISPKPEPSDTPMPPVPETGVAEDSGAGRASGRDVEMADVPAEGEERMEVDGGAAAANAETTAASAEQAPVAGSSTGPGTAVAVVVVKTEPVAVSLSPLAVVPGRTPPPGFRHVMQKTDKGEIEYTVLDDSD